MLRTAVLLHNRYRGISLVRLVHLVRQCCCLKVSRNLLSTLSTLSNMFSMLSTAVFWKQRKTRKQTKNQQGKTLSMLIRCTYEKKAKTVPIKDTI